MLSVFQACMNIKRVHVFVRQRRFSQEFNLADSYSVHKGSKRVRHIRAHPNRDRSSRQEKRACLSIRLAGADRASSKVGRNDRGCRQRRKFSYASSFWTTAASAAQQMLWIWQRLDS